MATKAEEALRALKAVARALAKDHGVEVIFDPSVPTACTDGKRIILPALDAATENVIVACRGFLDHEAGHILGQSAMPFVKWVMENYGKQGKDLLNVLEDIRVNGLMADTYIGCRTNIRLLYDECRKKYEWDKKMSTYPKLGQALMHILCMGNRLNPIVNPEQDKEVREWAEQFAKNLKRLPSCRTFDATKRLFREMLQSWESKFGSLKQGYEPTPPTPPQPAESKEDSKGEQEPSDPGQGESDAEPDPEDSTGEPESEEESGASEEGEGEESEDGDGESESEDGSEDGSEKPDEDGASEGGGDEDSDDDGEESEGEATDAGDGEGETSDGESEGGEQPEEGEGDSSGDGDQKDGTPGGEEDPDMQDRVESANSFKSDDQNPTDLSQAAQQMIKGSAAAVKVSPWVSTMLRMGRCQNFRSRKLF